jgi:hypothetical protein
LFTVLSHRPPDAASNAPRGRARMENHKGGHVTVPTLCLLRPSGRRVHAQADAPSRDPQGERARRVLQDVAARRERPPLRAARVDVSRRRSPSESPGRDRGLVPHSRRTTLRPCSGTRRSRTSHCPSNAARHFAELSRARGLCAKHGADGKLASVSTSTSGDAYDGRSPGVLLVPVLYGRRGMIWSMGERTGGGNLSV